MHASHEESAPTNYVSCCTGFLNLMDITTAIRSSRAESVYHANMLHERPVTQEPCRTALADQVHACLLSLELLAEGDASIPEKGYEDIALYPGFSLNGRSLPPEPKLGNLDSLSDDVWNGKGPASPSKAASGVFSSSFMLL